MKAIRSGSGDGRNNMVYCTVGRVGDRKSFSFQDFIPITILIPNYKRPANSEREVTA